MTAGVCDGMEQLRALIEEAAPSDDSDLESDESEGESEADCRARGADRRGRYYSEDSEDSDDGRRGETDQLIA